MGWLYYAYLKSTDGLSIMTETLRIDAFQENIHGLKILCQGPFTEGQFPPVLEYATSLKTPFKRRVLLTMNPLFIPGIQYSAIFQMKDMMDWSLALTYILHAPKDVLVVAEDIPIPDAVWAKLNQTITFVHIVTAPIPVSNLKPYDILFFAPIRDSSGYTADTMFKTLQTMYRHTSYQVKEFKETLNELRVAGAGLVLRVALTPEKNQLYWYDPVSEEDAWGSEPLSKKYLSKVFTMLAQQYSS